MKWAIAGAAAVLIIATSWLWNRSIELEGQLARAADTVRILGLENMATESVLSKHIEIKKEIAYAKAKREEQIQGAICFSGDERIDALLRLLEEDYDNHCGKAPGDTDATVRGAKR